MKLAAWNCWGLGNNPAVWGLLNFQKSEQVDILFLSETKMTKRRMARFKQMLSLGNMVVVDAVGKRGGIVEFWRSGVDVSLRGKLKNHIDIEIKDDNNTCWRFSGVYGESRAELKHETWTLMRRLFTQQENNPMPLLCTGDFNEILFHHEKEGGTIRSQACLDRFKEALEFCELEDLGFSGDVFTWRNKQYREENYIHERLDRAVANGTWRERFPLVHVKNGDHFHSDHRPIVVSLQGHQRSGIPRRGGRAFHFEASWLKEDNCEEVVKSAWLAGSSSGGGLVAEKLRMWWQGCRPGM
jgi:exonuclease III